MKALIINTSGHIRKIELTGGYDELCNAVQGTAMTAFQGEDYLIISSAEAEQKSYNINHRASAAAGDNIFGRVVVVGCKGEAWCDITHHRIDSFRGVRSSWTKIHRGGSAHSTARTRRSVRSRKKQDSTAV